MGKAESKEKIHWVRDVEKAILIAGFTGKPVFLMILKSLCPTCQAIEPKYVSSKEFRALSKFFVMAKSVDQDQVEEIYAPDGQYVPRVIFLDTTGKPMNQFYNLGANHAETRYFYPQADDIVQTMRKFIHSPIIKTVWHIFWKIVRPGLLIAAFWGCFFVRDNSHTDILQSV